MGRCPEGAVGHYAHTAVDLAIRVGFIGPAEQVRYIEDHVYANIWQTDQIAIIDLETGMVASWIDLTGLQDQLDTTEGIDVLNGIAYDKETGKIYVTGKHWPNLFEIKLKPIE